MSRPAAVILKSCFLAVVTASAGACAVGLVESNLAEASDSTAVPLISPIGDDGSGPQLTAVGRFFAPWIQQNFEDSQDFPSRMTFDGDWSALNNWENNYAYPHLANIYASVVEDQNRYFIHYGVFHPRDWCTAFDSEICFPPAIGGPWEHENDMQGATVVVDKRFATSEWPYGQILAIETIWHTNFRAYKNCELVNAFLYVQPAPSFRAWDGCIQFSTTHINGYVPPQSTNPAPSKRFALFVEKKGHAVKVGFSTSSCGPCLGFIPYYPTDNTAQEPVWFYNGGGLPSGGQPTPYRLQVLTVPELAGSSLWSKRLYFAIGSTPLTEVGEMGPHGVYYYRKIGGNNGSNDSANPPWAHHQDEDINPYYPNLVVRGDWHNHPAWAWAQHYLPSPGGTWFYEYCRDAACRFAHSYINNAFWSDAGYPQGGQPPPPPPPDCEVDYETCFETSAPMGPDAGRPLVSAKRWSFDEGLEGVTVSGARLLGVELVTLPDMDWGYSGGLVRGLRLRGAGPITLRLPFNEPTAMYDQVVVRIRTSGNAEVPNLLNWKGSQELSAPAARAIALPRKYSKGEWQVLLLPLRTLQTWKSVVDSVTELELTFNLGAIGARTIDVDFIVVGT